LVLLAGCAHISTYNSSASRQKNSNVRISPSFAKRTEEHKSLGSTVGTYHIGTLFKKTFTGGQGADYTLSYVRSTLKCSSSAGEVYYSITTKLTGPDGTHYIPVETSAPLPAFTASWAATCDQALKKAVQQTYYETLNHKDSI
jgi:hypothetical protein